MEPPKYHVDEIIGALSGSGQAWAYKNRKEEELQFGGEALKVQQENAPMPEGELLGQVSENKFKSYDGRYSATLEKKMEDSTAVAIQCIDGVVVILRKLVFEKEGKRIEGYWYAPFYPKPIPNQLTEAEAQEIYELIKVKEKECTIRLSRGYAHSRLENAMVGMNEYHHEEWLWPEGYAEHHVLKHGVKPSKDFLAFLGFR